MSTTVRVTTTVEVVKDGRVDVTFSKSAERDPSDNPLFITSTATAMVTGLRESVRSALRSQYGEVDL